MADPYMVLGVPPAASERQIHRAYRELAKRFHPDRWQEADPQTQAEAAQKMRELNGAYAILSHRIAAEPVARKPASQPAPRPRSQPRPSRPPPPPPPKEWTPEVAGPPPRALCPQCRKAYNKRLTYCPFCYFPNMAGRRWSYELTDRIGLGAVFAAVIVIVVLALVLRILFT